MDVDIFDKTIWPDGKDYTPLYNHVIRNISPLAAQQQHIENYIQMARTVSQTGAEEMRCTIRAIAQVAFIRVFNVYLLEHARAKKATEEEK